MEVVFDIERQNHLIRTCHSGLVNNLQSKASAGHYGNLLVNLIETLHVSHRLPY